VPKYKLNIPRPTLVKDKAGIYHVSYTHPKKGYSVKRSTGTRNRKEAEQKRYAIECDIMATYSGLKPANADYSIGQLLMAYQASKETIADTNVRALQKLAEFFGAFKADQLGDAAWKQYRKWRTAQVHGHASAQYYAEPRRISDSTAIRELNVFRAAISWTQRSPHWSGLAHVRVTLPKNARPARTEFLTREEAIRLVEACVEPHQRLFVLLGLATAARHRAILGLRWSQVTWPEGREPSRADLIYKAELITKTTHVNPLYPADHPSARVSLKVAEKPQLTGPIRIDLGLDVGHKRKPIAVIAPNNIRLYEALVKAYESRTTDFVIEWKRAGIGQKVDRVDLTDAYRRAGLKKPSAPQHILKHSAISWMVQDGISMARIAALTRTSIPTIERVYGHLLPEHLEVGEVLAL